jgi:hypothetical protein
MDGDCGGEEEASEKEGMGVCVAISRHERKDARLRQTFHLIGAETCPCPEFIYGSTGTCGYNMRVDTPSNFAWQPNLGR